MVPDFKYISAILKMHADKFPVPSHIETYAQQLLAFEDGLRKMTDAAKVALHAFEMLDAGNTRSLAAPEMTRMALKELNIPFRDPREE